MKKLSRILGYSLLVIVLLLAGLLTYIKIALPNVGAAPSLSVDLSPQRIERGRYLANNVSVCMVCHSARDKSKFAEPLVEGTLGKGGERFDQADGFPGIFYSKNITPAGIGSPPPSLQYTGLWRLYDHGQRLYRMSYTR